MTGVYCFTTGIAGLQHDLPPSCLVEMSVAVLALPLALEFDATTLKGTSDSALCCSQHCGAVE